MPKAIVMQVKLHETWPTKRVGEHHAKWAMQIWVPQWVNAHLSLHAHGIMMS